MTFDELKKRVPNAVESEWHHHDKGEGWVHRSAMVKADVYVGDGAIILGGKFFGGKFFGGEFRCGKFFGGLFFGGLFFGGEFHGGKFFGGEFRCGEFRGGEFRGGKFFGGLFFGGEFRGGEFHGGKFLGGLFHGGVWRQSPVFIQGSRYYMMEALPDASRIRSGCIEKPIEWWIEDDYRHLRQAAEENHYTPEQVEEYIVYAQMFNALRELRKTTAGGARKQDRRNERDGNRHHRRTDSGIAEAFFAGCDFYGKRADQRRIPRRDRNPDEAMG